MPRALERYARALDERRFFDAATDKALWSRWKERKDPIARALLILAAAYLHASRGNVEGARMKLGRVSPYLEQAPEEPLAAWLSERVEDASRALEARRPLPPLRLDDAPR